MIGLCDPNAAHLHDQYYNFVRGKFCMTFAEIKKNSSRPISEHILLKMLVKKLFFKLKIIDQSFLNEGGQGLSVLKQQMRHDTEKLYRTDE